MQMLVQGFTRECAEAAQEYGNGQKGNASQQEWLVRRGSLHHGLG